MNDLSLKLFPSFKSVSYNGERCRGDISLTSVKTAGRGGGGGDKTQTKMQHFHHGYNKCEMTEDDDTNETGRERNIFRVKDVNVLIYNDGL